jgi:hypothetical protein
MELFNVKGNAVGLSSSYCVLKGKDVIFNSMEQNRSLEANSSSYSRNSRNFMESVGLFPLLKEPATCLS